MHPASGLLAIYCCPASIWGARTWKRLTEAPSCARFGASSAAPFGCRQGDRV